MIAAGPDAGGEWERFEIRGIDHWIGRQNRAAAQERHQARRQLRRQDLVCRRIAGTHVKVSKGDPAANQALAAELTPSLMPLLCPGAVLAADPAIECRDLEPLPLPDGIAAGRYHLYRRL